MEPRRRLYDAVLAEHLDEHRQMAFVTGPRQVGKTTTCSNHADRYANWDDPDDRELVLGGPAKLVDRLGLDRLTEAPPAVLFDELHKYRRWKSFLKGFFDSYADRTRILVTGSSRLDAYRRGGDSLMGRYFLYRMHPFSVAEVLHDELPDAETIVRAPSPIPDDDFDALWKHGGYPEPFLKRDPRFTTRWLSLRTKQLLRGDVRDLTNIRQLDQIETAGRILQSRSAQQLVYSTLAKEIQVSVDTAKRWVDALASLHLGFRIQPWFKNVARSLRKEPKWYLRDWAAVDDPGARAETFVACHMLKAVEGWTDLGFGTFDLRYIRDKERNEVDLLVIRDGNPWILVEVKHKDTSIAKALHHYQRTLDVPFAFQVVLEADSVDADCFAHPGRPIVVPARTFLSQLL